MSAVSTPRAWSAPYSASPKSSPTGPTTCTSVKKDAASEKWTADPPSIRSRSPNGVLTASNAIDPATVTLIAAGRVPARRRTGSRRYAPKPMRAIQIEEFGGPEALQLAHLAVPEPREGQV